MARISTSTDIGALLRERRSNLGKSTVAVAQAANVPRSTLTRIESGRMNPGWSLVLAISQALDLQPVLVPRDKIRAVETVLKMSDAPETPPLAGEDWE